LLFVFIYANITSPGCGEPFSTRKKLLAFYSLPYLREVERTFERRKSVKKLLLLGLVVGIYLMFPLTSYAGPSPNYEDRVGDSTHRYQVDDPCDWHCKHYHAFCYERGCCSCPPTCGCCCWPCVVRDGVCYCVGDCKCHCCGSLCALCCCKPCCECACARVCKVWCCPVHWALWHTVEITDENRPPWLWGICEPWHWECPDECSQECPQAK